MQIIPLKLSIAFGTGLTAVISTVIQWKDCIMACASAGGVAYIPH